MLWTCFVTLLFLWVLGVATSLTLNGLIHLLPVAAATLAAIGTFRRRQFI